MKHTPNEDEIDEVDADDESEDMSPLLRSDGTQFDEPNDEVGR